MKHVMRSYLQAFGHWFTYDVQHNVHLWFGFLWGTPVPIVSIVLDLNLNPDSGRTPLQAVLDHPVHWVFLLHPILFALVFGAMGAVRHALEVHNEQLIRSLTDLATTDSLTGLHNRRYVVEELNKALQRAQRTEHRFSVVMFDLDGFKEINDTRGHAAGDRVLKEAAQALQGVIREGDVLGRYGGDEFLLVTYGDLSYSKALMDRAEQAVQEAAALGISSGLARFPEAGAKPETLVCMADLRMAQAKAERYAREGTRRRGARDQTRPENPPPDPEIARK